jgi:DNA-binding NarL/FixJ family response regulator
MSAEKTSSRRRGQAPVRVLVVDEEPVFRAGLGCILSEDDELELVGEAGDGAPAAELVARLEPDLLVIDAADHPDRRLMRSLQQARPGLKVLVLSAWGEPVLARALLAAGADGYALKRSPCDALRRAMKTVAAGGVYLDPVLALELLDGQSRREPAGASGARLSEREIQVLRLLANGHTAQEVATLTGLSARTLETYRARAMTKLELRSRADLVSYAARCGWFRSALVTRALAPSPVRPKRPPARSASDAREAKK